ncbi:MAG: ABC transporter permease [Candidatus Limnocylindria bacterium]
MIRSLPGVVVSLARSAVLPLAAIVAAFAVSAILIVLAGVNPLDAYAAMIQGSVGSPASLAVTGVRMTPILLTGLAVAISFRAGVFNIGAEGQLYLGAAAAAAVALVPLGIPGILHIILALLAGFVGGALWILVPAYLRAYRGVSEVVTTLMLNFVGILVVSYLVDPTLGPMGERGASFAQSVPIEDTARLPILAARTSLHAGLPIGVAIAIALYVLIQYTPFGFRLRMIGANPTAARFAGVRSARQMVLVMLLSGGIAGLAGAGEVMGLRHRLFDHFSPGYGYDGIAIALLAGANPLAVIVTAGFFGALRAGSSLMQQVTRIETSIVLIIQALTILFVIAGLFRGWFRQRQPELKAPVHSAESADA